MKLLATDGLDVEASCSPTLTPLDFFLWGYMQSLVYGTPVEIQHDLVARTAVAAGTIREMPGIFQRIQHNVARRCRTCNKVESRHFLANL
jgi:hypothetical protein